MTVDHALNELATLFGILPEFVDLGGRQQLTAKETKLALLRANGLQLDNDAMIQSALKDIRQSRAARNHPIEIIVVAGERMRFPLPENVEWSLRLEGAQESAFEGRAGADFQLPSLASGIHTLFVGPDKAREQIRVIAAPRGAPSLETITGQSRIWGLNTALYGLHSNQTRGLGDFRDLADTAIAVGGMGAAFLGINPVHSIGWAEHDTISPYSPSHRGFLNTAHIAADQIPGMQHCAAALAVLQNAGNVGSSGSVIDYQQHYRGHGNLLQELYKHFEDEAEASAKADFELFCQQQGSALDRFACFEALSEVHGADWRDWPLEIQKVDRSGAGVPEIAKRFHKWLQWIAVSQLSQAQDASSNNGMALGLYLDLAVGPRRGAAETWCETDTVADGVSIGAPPDFLSPAGQKWDLAGFAPCKLADTGYQALRDILAQTMRHCGVLRIDHVLGMNRSYWIPDDGSPGGYIKQPFESLLAVVAIEAERAETVVIGEDLGLVPDGFREAMRARGLYSYSVLQYEKNQDGQINRPDKLRPSSLACFGTHDTPTLKGYFEGRDIDWWQKLDWIDADGASDAKSQRQKEIAGLCDWESTSDGEAIDEGSFDHLNGCVHSALASSHIAMISVQLDDVLGEAEAQNLPGTIDEHPNWRRRCKIPVEALKTDDRLLRTAKLMKDGARSAPGEQTEGECQ